MSEIECKKHEWFYDSDDELGCFPCSIEKKERERIIKLLEDEIQRLIDLAGQREGGPAWRSAGIQNCEHTIALIKGESK